MKRFVTMVLMALLLSVQTALADGAGQVEFLDGLEHLEAGRWKDATASFARAIDADEENPLYYLARGVSRALGEDLKTAIADFDRVLRISPNEKHARLWKSVATNMQGRFMDGSMIYPQATHDQYENQVQDMARLYGEYNFRKANGDSDPEWDKKWADDQTAAKRSFPEIASLFANRVKGTRTDLIPLMYDRAAKKMAAGDFASALTDLQRAAEADPNDLRIVQSRATCNLNLGAPAAARAQFIRVLTAQSSNADAWGGHALACAALGDAVRAKASMENAVTLNPSNAKAYQDAFAAVAPASVPVAREALTNLATELNQLAFSGASADDLLKQATSVILQANAHRLRADETYLDRRLRLEAAARANPSSADALADLGEFQYTQAVSIRGEAVEPRAAFTTYRPQSDQSQAQEVALAEQTLALALQQNPQNVKALTFKAACAMFRLQWSDAETLLRTALSVDASYGPLLQLFAKVMDHAAGVKAVAASDLRSVKSWEDAYYYYYRQPTQAELQQAAEYERQAQALWAIAERHLEAAAANYAGKPAGFYYAGVLAKRRGQAEAARNAFEQCVALAPDHAAAWDELTENYYRAGMKVEAVAAKSAASNLVHTTAGHFLRLAWGQIVRTTYKTAGETLRKAAAIDPADPRSYAYLAVIAQAKGDGPTAMAWWRSAMALEEAHARFNGINFRSTSSELAAPELTGRAMAFNLRLGRLALELEQPDTATAAFSANLNLTQRLAKMDRFTPLASSQLPDQQTDETVIPLADTGLSLVAWSLLGLGDTLMKQGREAEATEQFMAIRTLPAQVPPTIDHGSRLADPCVLGTIAMLRPMIQRGEYEQAQNLVRSGGCGGTPNKELGDEFRRLSRLIDQKLSDGRMEEADQAAEDAIRRQQEELERFLKEREEQDRRRRPSGSPR